MNSAKSVIRAEIEQSGPISFARFMELALYAPGVGYYEQQTEIGRHGDFYTSVSVGSLFGELLAFQFSEWLSDDFKFEIPQPHLVEANPAPKKLQILEAGAHNGRLAFDILTTLQKYEPVFFTGIEYWILEPSARHRQWQQDRLGKFGDKIRWFDSWQSLPRPVRGIIFSNELLDAMPVRRLQWNSREESWFEMRVSLKNGEFVWNKEMGTKSALHFDQFRDLEKILPDGFITEAAPAASQWWANAASVLQEGKLLAIDYGLTDLEFFNPARQNGTLRSYFRHSVSDDLLGNPGEKDITAHVNFSELQRVGEKGGLKTDAMVFQMDFLTAILKQIGKSPEKSQDWSSKKNREFQTLTHPEHMGRLFRILVQSR